ncbi:glutamate racemase [Lampropedia puyangensis]|uniref:Glutamate racemase n=1 Tax=Lampropedia puyangensis TaxID=1330072 RepID=A0A4S8F3Y2_9BURK|nr:glutamate racemase [Lampropedia puyangensis]THT99911.1 glutamate racemase [Lampropedia puyangensis]
MTPFNSNPIGVFDSGIGGLSILKALQKTLPHESFIYCSDSGFAPYGERSDAFIIDRSIAITQQLQQQHQIKALVVACNTATTVAIHILRERFAPMPIIGVEPAIKPALASTANGHIAVLATARTLASAKYQHLLERLKGEARISNVACNGLAKAIENQDDKQIQLLCKTYMAQAQPIGGPPVDTIVLGCTHYPLILDALQAYAPASMRWLDSASAVANQTMSRLNNLDIANRSEAVGSIRFETSGNQAILFSMAERFLGYPQHV